MKWTATKTMAATTTTNAPASVVTRARSDTGYHIVSLGRPMHTVAASVASAATRPGLAGTADQGTCPQNQQSKQWVHTTYFAVPAGTKVNMTIIGYDGCTPLRNPVWGQVTGTAGGVAYNDGVPYSLLNSWAGCNVQHTFTMAGLGINVPIASPTTLKANSNLCGTSPCTSGPHQLVTFSFRTPAQGGTFRWQCIIPCGLGYLDGNGGPMATPGYMSGQMEVQA